jgi:hypothetical protein
MEMNGESNAPRAAAQGAPKAEPPPAPKFQETRRPATAPTAAIPMAGDDEERRFEMNSACFKDESKPSEADRAAIGEAIGEAPNRGNQR